MSHSHHSHSHAPHSFNVAFALAIFLNASFVFFQAIYALKAHSMSLLADAIHNAGDVFGLILAWIANWLLTLPARKRYSYGFRRATMFAALINALLLMVSSIFIIWESIEKLHHPIIIHSQIVAWVAFIGIIINGGTALLFMRGAHADLNIKSAFLHLANDALISFGVVIAAIVILFTQAYWIDALFGLIIVTTVLWSTLKLLSDSLTLILDAVPRHVDDVAIQHYLKKITGVTNVHDLHVWGLSTREVALTAHLVMPGKKLSDEELNQVNKMLKKNFHIDHATLQIESGSQEFPCHMQENC